MKSQIQKWKRDPVAFVCEALINPETGQRFVLYPEEERFLRVAFTPNADGSLPAAEIVFSAPKKSGKSTLGAMALLYVVVCLAGQYGEGYCCANDLEQAQSRVFQTAVRIVQASPLLSGGAKITNNRIEFRSTGASITALAADYAGAAGGQPSISVFDELWGYTSERSRRMWDELIPVPTRKPSVRLCVTYAGFSGESDLLEGLYKRGLTGKQIAPDLYTQPGMICYWTHDPHAPWQSAEWMEQTRAQLRPNQYARMIENRWVTAEETYLTLEEWNAITDSASAPVFKDKRLYVYAGLDASVKHDCTSLVCVAWDRSQTPERLRLVNSVTWQPSPEQPLDFEATVEHTLLDWRTRYHLVECRFDPYQLVATAQRLRRAGVRITEYTQSLPNLSAMASNLYELVRTRTLSVYHDDALRTAAVQAIAIEGARGWKIAKERQSHRIDPLVALAMAAMSAVEGRGSVGPAYLFDFHTGELLTPRHFNGIPNYDILASTLPPKPTTSETPHFKWREGVLIRS